MKVEHSTAPEGQREVYERQYSAGTADASLYGAWRELCAAGKADHVAELVGSLPEHPRSVAEIGCGDGVLLTQLARRGVGEVRHGFDISDRAIALAAGRPEIDRAERFDGVRLPAGDGSYDLGLLSHVLEHVPDPLGLLRETARACRAVAIELPLEANVSASRPSARRAREAIGHLHRFSRADVRRLAADTGLEVVAELADPLPFAVHGFFASTAARRAAARLKTASRRAVFEASAPLAERLFTVHYACVCVPAG